MAKKYRYCGDGLGVSGLPHEITDDEAKARGVESHLKDAIQAGLYEEVKETPARKERAVEPPPAEGQGVDKE